MRSSIIDVPRKHTQEDLFGIQVYQDALIKYIRLTDTPITIALQGEWGSGKTSLMNLLRYNLCELDNAPYFPIWINTWQYSLMKTPSQAIMSILEGIINQIGALNPSEQKWNESKKKIGGLFKKMATVGTKVAAGAVGIDGGVVDDLFDAGENGGSDIMQLKEEIAKLIEDALVKDPSKSGFTFYIDDLDRIDPPVAVEILELLKNIFDIEKCVFILAIDYDVVIKGLKPKFGELTEANEREFRSFFDKIIQLPFSMPVASYSVDTFLVDALRKIEFFTSEELSNTELAETLSEITRLSVGSNPRSLKRLTNTLALISIINEMQQNQSNANDLLAKTLNYALVCVQIAYPYIYNQLTDEPDFKGWCDRIASKLKLRPLTDTELESLNATEEFDEDWEKVVFRMCQKETYLSNRAFSVSQLLNKIAELINNDDQLGDIVAATIELSAVTNLKAFDGPMKKPGERNRDTSNYRFNGVVYTKKTDLVKEIVRYYLEQNPNTTHDELKEAFRIKKNMDRIFMSYEEYLSILEEKGKVEFFGKTKDVFRLKCVDKEFVICTNWPTTNNGKPAEFSMLLDILKSKLGYKIENC